jgi:hypothetical protein
VESIAKTYKSNRDKLIERSIERGFRSMLSVTVVSHEVELDYSVHEFIGSSKLPEKQGVRFAECELRYRDAEDSKR